MEVMPVKYEEYFNEEFGLDVSSTSRTSSNSTETLFPEELWSKFETSIESEDLFRTTYFDDFLKELTFDNTMDSLFAQVESLEENAEFSAGPFKMENNDDVMLHNHDCMWAGHCGSSEHPLEETKIDDIELKPDVKNLMAGGAQFNAPVSCKGAGLVSHQQSLLKPSLRSAGLPIINMITPQTPPMSDDEDKHHIKQTQVLRIYPTPEEYEDDADQDLCDYFGGKLDDEMLQNEETSSASSSSDSESDDDDEDEEYAQPEPSTSATSYDNLPNVTSIRSNIYATENDHSYHKDKNASMRMANLGIDTPSDSEEEIDVVSVSDKKFTAASRMSYALPTNPSMSDRCHLQRTMETAMNRRRRTNNTTTNNNGLKIMLPTKRQATSTSNYSQPAKRRSVETRGGYRRTKQYRMTSKQTSSSSSSSSSYRRRTNYNHDSESEHEPSEKRSLHNNMERQRRIDLRNAFEYLRQLVPEVLKKDRAAKVVILREASKYCDNLTSQSLNLSKQVDDLKRYQERLRLKVSMLRRNLALNR